MPDSPTAPASIGSRLPVPSPVVLVLLGIMSVQVGAGIAKGLFDQVGPTTLVFFRLVVSAVVLVAVVRPRVRGRTAADWRTVLGYAAALALMNWSIYQSFARIPLGIAVTIEFLGPLTVAVLGSRRRTDLLWVALAGLGVALLGLGPGRVTPAGVVFALLAATGWAAYIWASAGTGRRWEGLDGLAVASALAALFLVPLVALADTVDGARASDLADVLVPSVCVAVVGVGLLSSVVPYAFEMLALRRLEPRVFGILMSLEPAAAAGVGLLLLGELLGVLEWVAIVCVIVASIGSTRASRPRPAAA